MEPGQNGLLWCNSPAAVEYLMRVLGMSCERAKESVLDAGGSLSYPIPAWISKKLEGEGHICKIRQAGSARFGRTTGARSTWARLVGGASVLAPTQ